LLYEELHNLYSPPYVIRVVISRRIRWVGYVACMREMRHAYKVLVRNPEEERELGRFGLV
jgi:hypothetical protein